ncbi:hypothetical protein CcaverHIS641_0312260 [Cutaneotrichosporon cavernicola]|nr:hypothetical protein CcaverHIS641_0312260 [Cutaneotrichosporon cavernicola]
MPSPPALRITTDSLGLLFTLVTGAMAIATVCITGQHELIMSAYGNAYIAQSAWAFFATVFLVVTAVKPSSRVTSLLSASVWRGFLVVSGTAIMGYYCIVFTAVPECIARTPPYQRTTSTDANCLLPLASGIVGWITVVILALSLVVEICTLRGQSNDWCAPLAALQTAEDDALLNSVAKD